MCDYVSCGKEQVVRSDCSVQGRVMQGKVRGLFRSKSYRKAVSYAFLGSPIELFGVIVSFFIFFVRFDVIDVMP